MPSKPSKEQIRLLEEARNARKEGDLAALSRCFLQLARGLSPDEEEVLHGWVELWNDDILTYMSARMGSEYPGAVKEILKHAEPSLRESLRDVKLSSSDSVVFLLGAGASAPAPSNIPTVTTLLPQLWARARKIRRDDLDALAEWCNKHRIQNIEDLLTAAYIANFAAKNPSLNSLLGYFLAFDRDTEELPYFQRRRMAGRVRPVEAASIARVQETLQTLFGLLASTMIEAVPNPAHYAIVEFLKNNENASVITTNYDGCIDEAMINASLAASDDLESLGENGAAPVGRSLIKMHGSINWAFCESCQQIKRFDLAKMKKHFLDDTATYAVIGVCAYCGGQRVPLLVPPLAFKFLTFPHLISLWDKARQKIERADWIIVVGFSFSEADTYIAKTVARSLINKPTQRMIVCDTNADIAHQLRKNLFAQVSGFSEDRVIAATGSCDETVPQVLSLVSDLSMLSAARPR